MPQFKTNKTFSVVGIGQVLTGEIIEGEIKPGDRLVLAGKSYVIDAVETVDYHNGFSEIALIFDAAIVEQFNEALGQRVIIDTIKT